MPHTRFQIVRFLVILAIGLFVVSASPAQTKPSRQGPSEPPMPPWLQEFTTNPELSTEVSHLVQRLQREVQFPSARTESRLLPLAPDSTLAYGAFPNYGDAAHRALQIFREELQTNQPLRDWYQRNASTVGPKIEDAIEKFYQFSQYVGNEVAFSLSGELKHPDVIVFAEVRKPGLKQFLQQTIHDLARDQKSQSGPHVMDPQELGAIKDASPGKESPILVRPDFVIAASDLAALRSFNARVDAKSHDFASKAFGQRLQREYRDGVITIMAGDLQAFLRQLPMTDHDRQNLQNSGFADVKYAVSDQKTVDGRSENDFELSFTAPRHGPAAWLGAPTQPGSLDFVSPKALVAISLVLSDPSKIFDDIKALSGPGASGPLASLPQFEQAMNVSVKDDILGQLTGEITVELDSLFETKPAAKAILRVKDAARLQKTLATLLVASPFPVTPSNDGGFASYTLRPPGDAKFEIAYAFIDDYLIITSGHGLLMDAVRLHKTGESLGKSKDFLASLPKGHPSGISALVYEDPVVLAQTTLARTSPETAESLSKLKVRTTPVVACAYGEPTAIRAASSNAGVNTGMVLAVAAIAIPNLLRSRVAANQASAVGNLRTINTAQITYQATYPNRGFAPDLATVGPNPANTRAFNADHAALIDESLAGPTCASGVWCEKSGYRFTLVAQCKQHLCKEYVAIATPVDANTGQANYCTTSDGIVRKNSDVPLKSPITVKECQSWRPLP